MRNPERSALLKVSGLLGSTVVAMGLGRVRRAALMANGEVHGRAT
ncbi:hypothetical protein ACLBUN_09640, partial [Pseudomonas aeruginosa]